MREPRLPVSTPPCLLLLAVLAVWPLAAHAQVTIDLRALDALGPAPKPLGALPHGKAAPAAAVRTPALPPPPPAAPAAISAASVPAAPTSTAATPTAPAGAAVASSPPVVNASTAMPAMPALPAVAPPTPHVPDAAALAPVAARPAPAPISVGFQPNASDLTAADIARLKAMAAATPEGPETSFDVVAYASGSPEDPSSARRLSLSRGLAVRAALIAAGVPSTRIYVRAMGLATGPGSPDRADISVHGLSATTGVSKP